MKIRDDHCRPSFVFRTSHLLIPTYFNSSFVFRTSYLLIPTYFNGNLPLYVILVSVQLSFSRKSNLITFSLTCIGRFHSLSHICFQYSGEGAESYQASQITIKKRSGEFLEITVLILNLKDQNLKVCRQIWFIANAKIMLFNSFAQIKFELRMIYVIRKCWQQIH